MSHSCVCPETKRRFIIDTLIISGLQVNTKIGIYSWEQHILQPLLLDITIPLNIQDCQDNLQQTLDYARLCSEITHLLESQSFKLIETVAEKVAAHIKTNFSIVKTLKVSVSKPKAVKNASNITISIER